MLRLGLRFTWACTRVLSDKPVLTSGWLSVAISCGEAIIIG